MMIIAIDSNPPTFLLEGGVDCGRGRLDHRFPTRQPVLRIRDILVRIRIRGSVHLTTGPDPTLVPDPTIFVSDLQDGY